MNIFAILPDGSLALLPAPVAEAMSNYLVPAPELVADAADDFESLDAIEPAGRASAAWH